MDISYVNQTEFTCTHVKFGQKHVTFVLQKTEKKVVFIWRMWVLKAKNEEKKIEQNLKINKFEKN